MRTREKRLVFPFSAIVGQEKTKLALLAVAVNPLIGGVLLKGDKGTGKSTLVRALANVLPEIEVVADCPFNCNPKNPLEMCDSCYERYEQGESLPTTRRRMRVVDLPLSVTIDRLVGTIDVERFLKEGKKALQPGILAEANRGVLYIDEVNLLDDYIADSLLDAAAMGWNTIEREGISFRHPARFILVGSMNPEEGELRPQILDRFGLCVEVSAPMDPEERIEIVKRVEEFHEDPISFYRKYENEEKKLTERIVKARELLPKVEISDDLLKLLAETVVNFGIKTNRAEIATIKTAKAIAALNGREKVSLEDLEKAMELALPHRLRDRPFQKLPQMKPPESKDDSRHDHKHDHKHEHKKEEKNEKRNQEPQSQGIGNSEKNFRSSEAKTLKIESKNFDVSEFRGYRSSRDVSVTAVNFPKGVPVSYVPPNGEIKDVDFYNSLVWAVLNGKNLL
ncbi:ATP-binding protein [Thermococcus zilligii]|uniref:ATP-binding protein n=1 Tax=Thermococcus zilligii TaxID=54076 RepID=UPI000AC3B121|nr:ATP-binding protein [Thermococcus zilligii]